MGESAERMAKENGITRADQDAWALRSHQLAAAGTQDGRLTAEIGPVYVPPGFETVVQTDHVIGPHTMGGWWGWYFRSIVWGFLQESNVFL